ncbi:high-temperature-induced dauer-formation protein [Ophiocordyceps camponoti-floridani]|uniref:High-temperature-induced dauer-formation protein n=1 Tax=Ophiocordyceps camponoti-floridani TaxID=2030778 RepID=A0A8H4VC77_9HYPO|nr:high-temperature-induced dauer-formation protein [Ophiocordyceps camponoti-floridani]
MGASDSKIVFKQGIFRLSEERHIPADDNYWTSFWELPESAEDVFSLFSPADIRRTRDQALENIETLVLALTSRLFILRHHPSFPDPELAPERDALNCVRILTRILPYIYEKESLKSWEERFFWGTRRKKSRRAAIANEVLFDEAQDGKQDAPTENDEFLDVKPLAEELIDTLIDLLFFSDLTIPRQPHGQSKVTYAIWQSGVGCNSAVATTKEFENNRCEILRLLLALAGQSMYFTPGVLPQRGVRTLTYLCTCQEKQVVLSVLCSLLNTTLKYNPASWRVPYNTLVFRDPKQILVTYSLQLMLVLLVYPIPEQASAQKNFYRHFLGRLHRPQDFQFIVDGISRILSQPLQDKTSYLPGPQTLGNLTPEMLMLFWELTQCNKRFRSFIIDTERAHDFVVLTLFHALEYKSDPAKQGVVRMCAFLLQTLSVETNFGHNLNKRFEGQESLPACIRINGFNGSYTDFLVHSIYSLITSSQGNFTAVYPALLAVINNIAPHIEGLGAAGSSQLMLLFSSMSSPSFLLANETNHTLLDSLLESINSIIENKYRENPEMMLAIVKSRKRIEALRSFTLESGQEELERRNRRRKDGFGQGDSADTGSVRSSLDSTRSPPPAPSRLPTLGQVPEDSAFAIGDNEEDDSDDDPQPTPAPSTTSENQSQASSAVNMEDAVPTQLRGMSEKARGKMPAATRSFSRQNSTTSLGSQPVSGRTQGGGFEPTAQWIDSWLPELPLHSILTVIQQVTSLVPAREAVTMDTIRQVQEMGLVGVEPSPPHVHSFEWSQPALAWYESLLWGMIFTSEMQIAKGTMGMWNGTSIKLFRVQETAPEGPTLTSPRGAVDAVGSNIVSRIGQINLRGGPTQAGGNPPSRAGA